MLLHDLTWVAGIGSLLYFGIALLKPAWFLGDEPTAPEAEEVYIAASSTI